MTRPAKRGYSHEWPMAGGTTYNVKGIPLDLWARVRRRATREHISVRTLILSLLAAWLTEGDRRTQ